MDWFGIWFTLGLGGVMGGALVWHFKTQFVSIGRWLVSLFKGAQYLASAAKSDVASLEAQLTTAKAVAATPAVKS